MFSVLLSVYYKEKAEYLKEALESVLNQTRKPDEIVIVEDGPLTEELYGMLDSIEKENKCVKRVRLEKNMGLGYALNIGLENCTHDLVARMDTDDIAYESRFGKQVEFMENNPDIDACSSWVDEFEGSRENVISVKKLPETPEEVLKYARNRCPLNHPAVVYRKHAVVEAGGYKGFPEDYSLWVRMLMRGARFYNFQESLLYFRFSPEVIKRRGGWKYAANDLKMQMEFYRIGFFGMGTLMYNSMMRIMVRLFPNRLRLFIYKTLLRK